MRRFLLLLFFVFSFCLTAGAEEHRYALLVGVDDYRNIGKLRCCVKDMNDLKKALMKIGFEENDISIFTEKERSAWSTPYKVLIEKQIKTILKQTQEDDIVIIAFSGHGVRKDGQDYFCPQNANMNNIEGTCVSITQVMADIKKCKAKLKWIVVDACRSAVANVPNAKGNALRGNVLNPQGASKFQAIADKDVPDGVWLFQSCGKDQVSYEETREDGNGFFIKNLVKSLSLSSLNENGELTLLDVLSNTINKTQKEVKKRLSKDQKPHFKFNDENTDISLYKDENYLYAKQLVETARVASKYNNYKQAMEKYEEAVNRFPYNVLWKQELQMTKDIYDPKPKPLVTVPDDYANIADAYAHVKDDGVIIIRPGEYKLLGTIVVNRPVTIQGSVGREDDVIINCPSAHAFQITEGSPSFRNLTVSSSSEQCCGIYITGGTPKISHCILTSSAWAGMCIVGEKSNPIVESCFMTSGFAGLVVLEKGLGEFKSCDFSKNSFWSVAIYSGNPTFTNCKFHENSIGVNIPEKGRGNFNDCEIYENMDTGIIVDTSGNPTFTNCKIHDNKTGVIVAYKGRGNFNDCEIYKNRNNEIYVQTSGNPTFTRCNIHDGKGYGMYFWNKGRGKFIDCKICRNQSSVMLIDSNPTFVGCKFYDGKSFGIVVLDNGSGEFQDCEIYGNTLSGIEVFNSGNPTFIGCKIHDGKSAGALVKDKGLGQFLDCEIYENAKPGIVVLTSGNPIVVGCKIHDGESAGALVKDNGLGQFKDCEIYGNAEPGIVVLTSGNPTVTGCKIHDGKHGGVHVQEKGMGTFKNNILEKNYKKGQLNNWDIRPDAGKVIGSENTPPIPER